MQLNWLAMSFRNDEGYPRMAQKLATELYRMGHEIDARTFLDLSEIPTWLLRAGNMDMSRLSILVGAPDEKYFRNPLRQWVYTMYETTKIPDSWVTTLNACSERVLVPCQHNAEVFRDCGVKVPIHVVPLGIDPSELPLIERLPNGNQPFTILALADRGSRKGWDIVWQAFYKAFRDNPDVRLIVKSRAGGLNYLNLATSDKRIIAWREDLVHISQAFAAAHVVAIPSRGEGWGLPHREAAAMGIPSIAPAHTGTADVEHWGIPLRNNVLAPSIMEGGGEWYMCDPDELAEKFVWCYTNREDSKQLALRGAAWLRENQTWAHSAMALEALFEQYGASISHVQI